MLNLPHGLWVETEAIEIPKNIKCIRNKDDVFGGDLYFTADSKYFGVKDKFGTVVVADGFDAFVGPDIFRFGLKLRNFCITGKDLDPKEYKDVPKDDVFSVGAGLRMYRGQCLEMENFAVYRKEVGVALGPQGNFAYDNVMDVVNFRNLHFAYNKIGFSTNGWVSNLTGDTIYGYLNQQGLMHCNIQYDWKLRNIFSNGDSWLSGVSDPRKASLYFSTMRDATIGGKVVVAGDSGILSPTPLIFLDLNKAADWCSPYVTLENTYLWETDVEAISVAGNGGTLRIVNPRVGRKTGEIYGMYGGRGVVRGSIVKLANGSAVKVFVDKGEVYSELPDKSQWFMNIPASNIKDVINYNA